jgi:chitin disaccharide deacetylase
VRRLIVNADDFGFTMGVNRAIVEAHTNGIVTSSTLMANGRAFAGALESSKMLPRLSVGCHVVLIDGEPALGDSQVSSLTAGNSRFRDSLKSFSWRALSGRLDGQQIEAETTAQIRKLQAGGITVSHLDTHKHTHVFPVVLKPLMRAARGCGVRAIRNPFGPRRPLRTYDLLARPSLWTRYAEVRTLRALASKFTAAARREGFVTPDGTFGIVVTGQLDESLFRAIAELIPEGTWEFVCHPGYNDADLQSANTRLRESRETELRVLTMPVARELLAKQNIQLMSYHDLVAAEGHM